MNFVFQPLTWGFLLVLAPVLIHLINLLRHKRVQWAAMEFLLKSYRKHRRWVWMKQMALLCLRMLAIAAVVAMLARLVTQNQWSMIFGSTPTHHYVLLDDDFSTEDRVGTSTVFDEAKQVMARIGQAASQSNTPQKFTLIRFSRAASAGGSAASGDGITPAAIAQITDLNGETVDINFEELLEEKRRALESTQLAVGPGPALHTLRQMLDEAQDERRVVYVISDFRKNEWDRPSEAKESLAAIRNAGAEVHLVHCVKDQRANLAITALTPAEGIQAAGVPQFMNVSVANYGRSSVRQVTVTIRAIATDALATADEEELSKELADRKNAAVTEMPVAFEEIPPGETVTQRFQVYFPTAGQHVVEAVLPDDSVISDNRRWCVLDLPEGVPVLVIDGSTTATRASYFLDSIFQINTRVNMGVRIEVKDEAYLRDVEPRELDRYRTIYLCDVRRLDGRAVKLLDSYVERGGGLAIFLGANCQPSFYREWHNEGKGLFPMPLDAPKELGDKVDLATPDVQFDKSHPIARFLDEIRVMPAIYVARYFAATEGWEPKAEEKTKVIATLRNRAPLMIEKIYGDGRVLVATTSLSSISQDKVRSDEWSNWGGNPIAMTIVLEMQGYLETDVNRFKPRQAGAPVESTVDRAKYKSEVKFVTPGKSGEARIAIGKQLPPAGETPAGAEPSEGEANEVTVAIGKEFVGENQQGETDRAGVYEIVLTGADNKIDVQRIALNVDPQEGDLAFIDNAGLTERLSGVKVEIHDANSAIYDPEQEAGFHWSIFIMFALIALLLGEQLLAYSASYHPKRGTVR